MFLGELGGEVETLRLSQHHTSGALSCWWAVMIKSRYSCQANVLGSPLRSW